MTITRLISLPSVVIGSLVIITLAHTLSGRRGQAQPMRREGLLQVGDVAPDFTLKTLDGTAEVKLSSYRGRSLVALIFGSYT